MALEDGCDKVGQGTNRRGERVDYCPLPKRDEEGKCVCPHASHLVEVGGILRIGCDVEGVLTKEYNMYSDPYEPVK